MITACSQCAARYSVADEKIRGLKAKVLCKRCGHPMLVDGTALGVALPKGGVPESAPKAPVHRMVPLKPPLPSRGRPRHVPSARGTVVGGLLAPASDREHWYVAENEAAKELSVAAIAEGFRRGEIGADTYVFRDGMKDWAALHDAPELMTTLGRIGIRVVRPEPVALAPADEGDDVTRFVGTAPQVQSAASLASAVDDDGETRIYSTDLAAVGEAEETTPIRAGTATADVLDEATRIHAAAPPAEDETASAKPFFPEAPDAAASKAGASGRSESTRPTPLPKASVVEHTDEAAVIVGEVTAPRRAAASMNEATPSHRSSALLILGVAAAGIGGFLLPRLTAPPPEADVQAPTAVIAPPPLAAKPETPPLAPPQVTPPLPQAPSEQSSANESLRAPSARTARGDTTPVSPAHTKIAREQAPAPIAPPLATASPSAAPPATEAAPPVTEVVAPAPAPPAPHLEPFNPAAANAALGATARRAEAQCTKPGQPNGGALVLLTIAGVGRVVSVSVRGPLVGTPTGLCILRLFNSMTVPPFDGDARSLTQSLMIP